MSDDTSLAADLSAAMSATADTSESSTAAATDDAAAQTGTATTEPAAATTATSSTTDPTQGKQGPIPFDVQSKALENARAKAVAEAQAAWEQQYGWSRTVDRTAVEEAARLGTLFQTDRAAFVRELIADRELPPDLVSEFARVLGSRRGQSANSGDVDLDPDVPLLDANGNPTGVATYSAPKVQALMKQAVQQAISEVTKTIAPLQETHKAIQEEREGAANKAFAQTTLAELRKQPFFAENEPAIKAVYAKIPIANPKDQAEVNAALRTAYLQVLTGTVIPNLQSTTTRTVVQGQQQKANANTVTPGSPGSGTPKDPKDQTWSELYKGELAARGR